MFVAVVQVSLVGQHQAGADRDHAHLGRPLHRQRLHQRQHPGLGGAIGCGAGRCAQGTDAADEDDAATLGLALHQTVSMLGRVERRDKVQPQDALVKAWRGRGGNRRRATASIVDQHVEAAEVTFDGVEQCL
ncbi:hypothetical protein D3C80_1372720 [compost metagenome]